MKAIQYIRLIGKEFISLTDAELHLWVEMVRPMVSRKQFGKLYEQAIAYLVCHKLKMAGYGENPLDHRETDQLRIGGTRAAVGPAGGDPDEPRPSWRVEDFIRKISKQMVGSCHTIG